MGNKILIIFAGLLLIISSNCYAMQFSQIVKMGSISGNPIGGFIIDGATQNNGSFFRKAGVNLKQGGEFYEKGVARYGNEDNALWVYYDCSNEKGKKYQDAYSPLFGDKNKNITVRLGAGEGENVGIYNIKNDKKMTLFFLAHRGCIAGAENYVVMGYDRDNKFVKYIDITDVAKKYIGEKNMGIKGIYLDKYYCRGNTIVVEYVDPKSSHGWKSPIGEFRFKWDDAAQWFGVEQVVY